MAIASLSTLSTQLFRGGKLLTPRGTGDLADQLNTMIAKINEMITGWPDHDTLNVGSGAGPYYAGGESWLTVDGTNPPTMPRIRLQDQTTGAYRILQIAGGVVAVV